MGRGLTPIQRLIWGGPAHKPNGTFQNVLIGMVLGLPIHETFLTKQSLSARVMVMVNCILGFYTRCVAIFCIGRIKVGRDLDWRI